MTYKLYSNKILRIVICVLLAVILCIVPFEQRMLVAEAALTSAVAISVICSVLVAMGFTFGRVFLTDGIDAQFKKFSIAQTVESLKKLAVDIWQNCPNIYAAVAACFPNGGDAFNTAYLIIQTSPLLYQLIKRYIIDKYGSDTTAIEDGIILTNSGYSGNPISVGGYTFCSFSAEVLDCPRYGSVSVSGYDFYWEFVSVSSTGVYTYRSMRKEPSGSIKSSGTGRTRSPSSVSVVLQYGDIYAPDDSYPYGCFKARVYYPYDDIDFGRESKGSFVSLYLGFNSIDEYNDAVKASAGETDPNCLQKSVEIDDNAFNSNAADYPRYVYIYENTEEYVGKTAANIAAPAYSETCDSEVVDNIARTVTWVGDRTLCPIDDLQAAIPSAVIGNWVASWEAEGTLCNITCYAEDGTIAWQGEVATSLTWADVLARLGDISITGAIPGAAVGSFAAADAALNFDPLKIAGQTFSKKFPFCLPFDLYRAFKQFDYDTGGKAPVYEIPLNFGEQFGTHYIVLDMAKWTPVANIVKWCVYVSFMVSLIIITKKVMGGS